MEKWYVAHSKPRNEELLWKQFCLRNLETYYPRIKVSIVNSHTQRVQPYFPGYLFTHVDLELIGSSILKWMPGGTGLVLFGDEPAVIPDSLIYAIKQRVDSLTKSSDKNPVLWRKGDNIAIHEGILTGYEGIFDVQLSGTDRVRILLSLLGNRFLPVEISASCIQRIDQNEFVWDR